MILRGVVTIAVRYYMYLECERKSGRASRAVRAMEQLERLGIAVPDYGGQTPELLTEIARLFLPSLTGTPNGPHESFNLENNVALQAAIQRLETLFPPPLERPVVLADGLVLGEEDVVQETVFKLEERGILKAGLRVYGRYPITPVGMTKKEAAERLSMEYEVFRAEWEGKSSDQYIWYLERATRRRERRAERELSAGPDPDVEGRGMSTGVKIVLALLVTLVVVSIYAVLSYSP